jgi:hypothetical protein
MNFSGELSRGGGYYEFPSKALDVLLQSAVSLWGGSAAESPVYGRIFRFVPFRICDKLHPIPKTTDKYSIHRFKFSLD